MLLSDSTKTGFETGDDDATSVLKLFPSHMHACALALDSVGSLKYHRIMECFEWERILKIIQFCPPTISRDTLC